MESWQLQEAKARLSELVRKAKQTPQSISVRGKEEVVLLSRKEYDKLTGENEKPDLLTFMQQSPLYGLDIEFGRDRDTSPHREIEW